MTDSAAQVFGQLKAIKTGEEESSPTLVYQDGVSPMDTDPVIKRFGDMTRELMRMSVVWEGKHPEAGNQAFGER